MIIVKIKGSLNDEEIQVVKKSVKKQIEEGIFVHDESIEVTVVEMDSQHHSRYEEKL